MSKMSVVQKRQMGKRSPLSKRPKLDFTIESPRTRNGYNSATKENAALPPDKKIVQNTATSSEWDDDFSGDVLEKVCLIADLSQAMAENNEPEKKKALERTPVKNLKGGLEDELEKLRLENEKLKESFKTKEGEVQILRSQLKQHQEAKQSEAVHNSKILEEMDTKYKEKLCGLQKDYESLKTELQFKELELESLKCKKMEKSGTKIRKVEPEAMHVDCRKSLFNSSQIIVPVRMEVAKTETETTSDFDFSENPPHEGKNLAGLICPEIFKFIPEPDVIPLYTFKTNCHMSRLDFDKREKYKWSDLPKPKNFLKDTYDLISNLFLYENLSEKKIKPNVDLVLEICTEILSHQRDVLIFLEEIQRSENDDIDQLLLENEEEVAVVNLKNLLGNGKIREEECGIEARRSLALILSLAWCSKEILALISSRSNFLEILKNLATSVGNLRRPLRYTGILIGIVLILNEILRVKNLKNLDLIKNIIQEIIFSRPKLDVFREIISALETGLQHKNFLPSFCKKGSSEALLFMDSKLQQAMFFTKDACPLKLLSIQIQGLACLPCSRKIRLEITKSLVKWLNFLMDQQNFCVPCNSPDEEKCFDITECLVYLLNLNIKDFKRGEKSSELISVIGDGAALIQRILKLDQRQFHDNMHNLRFATELKSLKDERWAEVHGKAIGWIVDLFESDLRNQDGCVKQNICKISNDEMVNALRINNNDSKIY